MKLSLKSILCNVSYALNIQRLLGPFGKNRIIILMYHGITNSDNKSDIKNICGYNITAKAFEKQIEYLSKYCNVIKASDAIEHRNISDDKKNVVLTFDDGYRNNYTNAFPVLVRYKLPALFAITTAFVTHKELLWNDIIEYAAARTNKIIAGIEWQGRSYEFKLWPLSEKVEFYKWVLSKCVKISQDERTQFIKSIFYALDIDLDYREMMKDPDYESLTPAEIQEMAETDITEFASHSVNHLALSSMNEETLSDQVVRSKSEIEKLTGLPCRYFCLPGGFYDESVIDTIKNAGFEKIFSSDLREIDPDEKGDVLGRYCVTRSLTMPLFSDMLHGPIQRIRRS